MATQTKQQVAEQLNKLQKSGASEDQISAYVSSTGYKDTDFNIDLNGSFTPLAAGGGKVAGVDYVVPTAAEQAESDNFARNLAASSTSVPPALRPLEGPQAASTTTRTVTETTTTTFNQSTGGGSSTVYSGTPTNTPASLALQGQANQSSKLAAAYEANPNSKFGQATLDRSLREGTITQEEYNKLKNATPEERDANLAKATELKGQANKLNDEAAAAQEPGQSVVAVQPQTNTSEVNVTYEKTVTQSSTSLKGEITEANVKVETQDGVDYQVTNNANGTKTYTPADAPNTEVAKATSVTVEDTAYTPLQEPPNPNPGEYDEFAGVDAAAAANANGLKEPPLLSDEEVQQQLANTPREEYVPPTQAELQGWAQGTSAPKQNTTAQATAQDQANFTKQEDWRVKLSLSPTSTYLYRSKNPGILKPLSDTNGVVFPYTPNITVNYTASYDPTDLVHSNYKVYQYKNSSVDSVSIACDFTAQDTYEANYLLAVIHFFRSVTKMFYGQDNGPKPGTPPPLCFITGLGAFQFNEHPLVITSFSYVLPNDVDYIRAGQITSLAGVNQQSSIRPVNSYDVQSIRLQGVKPGGSPADTQWGTLSPNQASITYVPTKMQIQLSALPIVSRNDASNNFSLTDYASGKLLRGIQNVRGGFW